MIAWLLSFFAITADIVTIAVGAAIGIAIAWGLPMIGQGRMIAIVLGVAVGILPASFIAGRWKQAEVDNVAQKIADLEATTKELQKAKDDAAAIVLKQAEATSREREARMAAEKRGEELEEQARREDEENAKRMQEFVCPAVVPPQPGATPPPRVVFKCPDPGLAGDDDLDRLRKRYPQGPLKRR